MERLYKKILKDHLDDFNQMVFVGGPRQVGKTTIAKSLLKKRPGLYLSWDDPDDKELILGPYTHIEKKLPAPQLGQENSLIIFDEIHKYKDWKNHIKGFFDKYKEQCHILVTGSAKLDTYKRSGDSLMGRYFSYTVCPLSVREVSQKFNFEGLPVSPLKIDDGLYNTLWDFGGFPEPFLKDSLRFSNMWQKLREQQLFREDIRDTHNIKDFMQFELFAKLVKNFSGKSINYTSFSKHIRVADQTIRRWFDVLELNYYSFRISPWTKNISRSLLKEPKFYLWDWSRVEADGAKFENFIAVHLMKFVHYYNDMGLGEADLHYLRTKEGKEVDFIISLNQKPWCLIECKLSNSDKIHPELSYFKDQTNAKHAFQVVHHMDYIDDDCFKHEKPIIVPAKTLLSQFV